MNVQPAQAVYVTQQPGAYVQAPNVAFVNSGANPADFYKSTFKGVGITQVTIGCLCLILGIVIFIILPFGYAGAGVWGGIWYIVSGSLAIASGTNPNNCNVTAGLVLSILATIVAFVAMIIDALACSVISTIGFTTFGAIHGVLAFLSFVEFVIAIVHSAFCCKANCGRPPTQTAVIATTAMTTVPLHQNQSVPPYTPEKM